MIFRTLHAEEIECRVQSVHANGCILLLYKDARCDMAVLDETVGVFDWKREHTRDNANCIVSIWDEKKNQWISKEDTGSESNTEAKKGLASDSFKRACFNWGIGRELYSAPFIWISSDLVEIEKTQIQQNKTKYVIKDRRLKFKVASIGYDDKRRINSLEIVKERCNTTVFVSGEVAKEKSVKKPQQPTNQPTNQPNQQKPKAKTLAQVGKEIEAAKHIHELSTIYTSCTPAMQKKIKASLGEKKEQLLEALAEQYAAKKINSEYLKAKEGLGEKAINEIIQIAIDIENLNASNQQ